MVALSHGATNGDRKMKNYTDARVVFGDDGVITLELEWHGDVIAVFEQIRRVLAVLDLPPDSD
jgi:hypothetical protein